MVSKFCQNFGHCFSHECFAAFELFPKFLAILRCRDVNSQNAWKIHLSGIFLQIEYHGTALRHCGHLP